MGYDRTQLDTLEIAWKRGYLSNTEHYTLLSKITGLNRKQISNWARGKIRKLGSAPLPSKTSTSNSNTSVGKSRDGKRFLEIAWNTGLLPGTENYTLIQDFTGLSRKQISNWSRARVRKKEINQISGKIGTQTGVRTSQKVRKMSHNHEMARKVERRMTTTGPNYTPELKWLLMNAVNGLENINEDKIGVLSTLIGFPKDALRKFFLANGRRLEDSKSIAQEAIPDNTLPGLEPEASVQSETVTQSHKPKIKTEKIEEFQEKVLLSPELTASTLLS